MSERPAAVGRLCPRAGPRPLASRRAGPPTDSPRASTTPASSAAGEDKSALLLGCGFEGILYTGSPSAEEDVEYLMAQEEQ